MKDRLKNIYYAIFMCWGCFSIIPCPNKIWSEDARNYMLIVLKYFGILLGVIQLFIVILFNGLINIPTYMFALIIALYPPMICGFIHMDGFMDCMDAIFSRRDIEERKRILKDSNVGSFAAIGLVIVMLVSFVSILAIVKSGLILEYVKGFILIMFLDRYIVANEIFKSKNSETSQYYYIKRQNFNIDRIISLIVFILICTYIVFSIGTFRIDAIYKIASSVIISLCLQKAVLKNAIKSLGAMSGDISGYSIVTAETIYPFIFGIISNF